MSTDRVLRQTTPAHSNQSYALLLWGLTVLFAFRVVGQAIQRWLPLEFLPPFEVFQGSALPYWFLLPAQLLILAIMVGVSRRVQTSALTPSRRSGAVLTWAGAVYMTVALGRLALGSASTELPAWFHAWIPAIWHVVLASFVLVIGRFHARESAQPRAES